VASLDPGAPVVMLDAADATGSAHEGATPRSRPTSTYEVVGSSLEDELEEADFYLAQGMIDEARTVLSTLLESFPDNPTVQAKLRDLPAPEAPEPALEAVAGALRIEALAGASGGAAASQPAPPRSITTSAVAPASRRNVVEHGVGADDFESHFDLGIAYKEMGLLDQAIGEFKTASRDATREVQCQQMMGLCYLAKGMPLEAVRQFKQGLYAEGIREDEELSLYYELGQAYELLNDRAEALYYYERIRKRKARYRDLDRRIESLGRPPETFGAPPAAIQRK
jgi:pilus assembly protein FimV